MPDKSDELELRYLMLKLDKEINLKWLSEQLSLRAASDPEWVKHTWRDVTFEKVAK